MNMKKSIFFIFPIMLLMHSCYYDNASELFPQASLCDTSGAVTFTNDIQPLVNGYCGAQNSCHNNASSNNNYVGLSDYNSMSLVDSTALIESIEHTGSFPMPKNGGKLSDCRINLIKKWLRTGKPQ
jgi:hypothetical protein